MIELRSVNKFYHTRRGDKQILKNVDLKVNKGERVGILGRNGAGKSTLIRIISGAENPTQGHVFRDMTVSWPLAFSGAFQNALTGYDNLRFICRIYNTDPEDKLAFVEQFSELGIYLREPLRSYSAGMRARLAFAISMVIEFDCFLIDEIVAVGDAAFHQKCHVELYEKRADRAMILVSHDANYVLAHCHRAAVLEDGSLYEFDSMQDAYQFYYDSLNRAR